MRQPVFELVRQGNTLTCPHCFDQNNNMYICHYLEILDTYISSIDEAKKEDADQTAQICRLICVFVVRILQKTGFLITWLLCFLASQEQSWNCI